MLRAYAGHIELFCGFALGQHLAAARFDIDTCHGSPQFKVEGALVAAEVQRGSRAGESKDNQHMHSSFNCIVDSQRARSAPACMPYMSPRLSPPQHIYPHVV